MSIYYVKSLFRLGKGEGEESKQGYVLAETLTDAMTYAADKIRTYGRKVNIHFMECSQRNDQLKVVEKAEEQPVDHWDKLFLLSSKR